MDDIVSDRPQDGPSKAWKDLINENILHEISHSDYHSGRGQSVGKYLYEK